MKNNKKEIYLQEEVGFEPIRKNVKNKNKKKDEKKDNKK